MDAAHKRIFQFAILAFSLLSSVALADQAAELERAKGFYDKQQMVDAFDLMKKLAEQNYLPAQARLGEMLDYTEADEEAVGWYLMAAFQGNAEGAYGLGKMYQSGEGIKKELGQALFWFRFAAERDNLNAIKVLEVSYRIGEESELKVQADLKESKFWETKRIPMEAALMKAEEEKRQALLKSIYEKQEALKKEIQEANKKSR